MIEQPRKGGVRVEHLDNRQCCCQKLGHRVSFSEAILSLSTQNCFKSLSLSDPCTLLPTYRWKRCSKSCSRFFVMSNNALPILSAVLCRANNSFNRWGNSHSNFSKNIMCSERLSLTWPDPLENNQKLNSNQLAYLIGWVESHRHELLAEVLEKIDTN